MFDNCKQMHELGDYAIMFTSFDLQSKIVKGHIGGHVEHGMKSIHESL